MSDNGTRQAKSGSSKGGDSVRIHTSASSSSSSRGGVGAGSADRNIIDTVVAVDQVVEQEELRLNMEGSGGGSFSSVITQGLPAFVYDPPIETVVFGWGVNEDGQLVRPKSDCSQ